MSNQLQNNKPFYWFHPATLMLLFWSLIYACYFFGPIQLNPTLSLKGFLFTMAHLAMFVFGATFLARVSFSLVRPKLELALDQNKTNLLIYGMLIIGSLGAILSIFGKLAVLDNLSFETIAMLRTSRAQDLLHAKQYHLNYYSALGFLTYPAGFVGLIAALIYYEIIPTILKVLLYLFMFLIFCVAIIAGGRSPILVLFLFIGTSYLIRWKMKFPPVHKSLTLNLYIVSLVLLFVVYNNFVWHLRIKESGLTSSLMLQHAAQVWGAKPTPFWDKLIKKNPKLKQTIVSSSFYALQSVSITERLLASEVSIPVMYGAYQIDLLAAFFRLTHSGLAFLKKNYELLMYAGVYGYFTGAWSALYIDLGYGSFFAALLWGLFAGRFWRNFENSTSLDTSLPYTFVVYSILISFASGPLGFSNSCMLFIWIALATVFLKLPIARSFKFQESPQEVLSM